MTDQQLQGWRQGLQAVAPAILELCCDVGADTVALPTIEVAPRGGILIWLPVTGTEHIEGHMHSWA